MSLLPIQKRNAHIPRHHFNSAFNRYTGSSRVKYKAARHPGDNKPSTFTLDLGGEKNTGRIRKMGRRFRQGVCTTPNNTTQYNASEVLSPGLQSDPATLSSTSPPCYHSTADSNVNTILHFKGDHDEGSPCRTSAAMSGSATTSTSVATELQLQTLSPLSIVMGRPQGRLSTRRGDYAPPISPAERIWAPSSVDYVAPQQLDAYLGPPPVPQAVTHSPTTMVGAPTFQSNDARRVGRSSSTTTTTTTTQELMMAMGTDASQQPTGLLENFDWASSYVVDQGMAQAQNLAPYLPPSDAGPTRTTHSRDLPPSCHDKHNVNSSDDDPSRVGPMAYRPPMWRTHAGPEPVKRERYHPYQTRATHGRPTVLPQHSEEKHSMVLPAGQAPSKPMCRTRRTRDVSLYEAAAECQLIGLDAARAIAQVEQLRNQDVRQMHVLKAGARS